MKKLIFALLPTLALLAGCQKQDSATYSGIESGHIASGVFTSDNGTVMTVAGNEWKYDVTTSRRVLISYETHPVTDPNHIDIDLQGLLDAVILQPTHAQALPEDPTGSSLQVSDAWFSKDYLNILVAFQGNDPTLHDFSSAYTADEKGIVIRLDHDGSQDTGTGTSALSCFLSVPIYEPLLSYEHSATAAGIKSPYPAPFTLQWTGNTLTGGPQTLYERQGSYTPSAAD